MAYVIAEPCRNVKDGACAVQCPVDAIGPLPDSPEFAAAEQLYIDPGACIDCDLCVDECPVRAIFPDHDLPDEWAHFAAINAEWFNR